MAVTVSCAFPYCKEVVSIVWFVKVTELFVFDQVPVKPAEVVVPCTGPKGADPDTANDGILTGSVGGPCESPMVKAAGATSEADVTKSVQEARGRLVIVNDAVPGAFGLLTTLR